ncbi:hypothetical protein [Micromonospora lupini]|uniref:hypothetical protein n=1 Tax=Micromonospora lupini TaxID=285679 RepID=UPI0033E87C88
MPIMKATGALMMVLGIIAGIVLLLLPANVSVFGTSVSCAPPVIQLVASDTGVSDDPITASVTQDCKSQSVVRCILGLAVFAVAVGGGAIMLVIGNGSRPDPQWVWDGYRWTSRV